MSLTPKNWDSFQHYKNRSPAWIKLHRGLLDDFDFARLPVASRALAPLLWLLASEYEDGKISASMDEIAFRFRMSHDDLIIALTPLIESKFFDASEVLAERKQSACLEKEDIGKRREEEEREATASAAPPDPAIPEREYFERGREVLGKGAGAMIANLLKAKGRNVALARSVLEAASQKQKPIEYVAAAIRGPPAGKPLTEFQRKQQETNDVRAQLRNLANGGGSGGTADRFLSADHGERPEGVRGGAGSTVLAIPGALGSGSG